MNPWTAGLEYAIDVWQRNILFLDVMRQRGNQYREHMAQQAPNVLDFKPTLVIDGRHLARPVNYALVAIVPPPGVTIDPERRPFVVFDPRAGHGPGIGGFKTDSEIGVALRAGHPCYFVGFLPEPVPGQTIEDIMAAEALFLETVIARHPQAEGKPCVIGNCQAGWAVMMLAAVRPELFGPLILAGSPLSYWAGQPGGPGMRYSGGLLGGSWLTALLGDLGNGRFDGAWLVSNFENLNPANTLWTKKYNLWSKIDTEAARYLGFERWWGGHVMMNAEEIQFIVDELFVGNRLSTAEIVTRDGVHIDLRNVQSPILCFCSQGDDITPPAQALGWITDLYERDEDLIAHGQTIVYSVHDRIGHLGIFVSGGVARREHEEFASNIDLIDVLPPGLYEAVLTPRREDDANPDLIGGNWIARFERRRLDDIRRIVGGDPGEERLFAAARRVSEINLGLYRTFLQPFVRAFANEYTADLMQRLHPARLPYEAMSDDRLIARPLAALADQVREARAPASPDNPFVAIQEQMSQAIVTALDGWRDARDRYAEGVFRAVYDAPLVQALMGLRANDAPPRRRPGHEPEEIAFIRARIADLKARIGEGGLYEAFVRAMLYIGFGADGPDERDFAVLNQIRREQGEKRTLGEFKQTVREQFLMLLLNETGAIEALPGMVATEGERASEALALLRRVVGASGTLTPMQQERLARIEQLFGGTVEPVKARRAGEAVRARP